MSPKKIQDITPKKTNRKLLPKEERPTSDIPKGNERSFRTRSEDAGTQMSSEMSQSSTKTVERERPSPARVHRKKPRRSKLLLVVSAALIVVFAAMLSIFFEKTLVKITPKQETVLLDAVFTAFSNSENLPTESLLFETLAFTHEETETIPATEVKQVDRYASGEITVYNDFSSQTQRLIKNTRFETPEGLVYRIRESIDVPGKRGSGGDTIPGSLKVRVYADEPGEKYNIGLTDFTIPGFKGTPRFKGFYARSEGSMEGGYVGAIKTVSEQKVREVKDMLRERAQEKIIASAHSQAPEQFILYPDALISVVYDTIPAEETDIKKDTVSLSVKTQVQGIMFDRAHLSKFLGQKLLEEDLGEEEKVRILNLEELSFAFTEPPEEGMDLSSIKEITFSLQGNPYFVWEFDEKTLKEKLLGRPKDTLRQVLSQFPSIVRAEVTLRPFWKRAFPETPEDIVIEEVLEEGEQNR